MLPLGSVKCFKTIVDGPMNKAHSRKRKIYECTHELINMNKILMRNVNLNPIQWHINL